MTAFLLDANVLIAIAAQGHEHHDLAERWFAGQRDVIATCPITEGALVRYLVRHRQPMSTAQIFLRALSALDNHEFWPDDLSYTAVAARGVIGHRQVTDAYLAQLARQHGGRVATLDKGFAALRPDVVELVPTS